MDDDITTAVKVLAGLGGAAVVVWLGVVFIKAAKRGGGGMHAVGAALRNDPVPEAQDGRIRKGLHSGDPLDRDPPAA